jgi:flagellar secretion chaperone FliS
MASLASARSKYVNDSVTTMSPGQMIVALYDRMLLDLERATAAIASNDVYGAHTTLMHAQEILDELLVSLDTKSWSGGPSLATLYRHIKGELVIANMNKDATPVIACKDLLIPLRDAWREAAGIVVPNAANGPAAPSAAVSAS